MTNKTSFAFAAVLILCAHTALANGNVCVSRDYVQPGMSTSGGTFVGDVTMADDVQMQYGDSADAVCEFDTAQTPDAFVCGGARFVYTTKALVSTDLALAGEGIYVTDSTGADYANLYHDGTNLVLDTNAGVCSMPDGASFGDSNVTNVGDIALDSMTPDDGSAIKMSLDTAALSIHDGSEPTWGHAAMLQVEGGLEVDGTTWVDGSIISSDYFRAGLTGDFRFGSGGARLTGTATDGIATYGKSDGSGGVTLDGSVADTITIKDFAGTGNGNLTVTGGTIAGGGYVALTGVAAGNVRLKDSSGALHIRTGSDSAFATMQSGSFTASGNMVATGTVRAGSAGQFTFGVDSTEIGAPANGQITIQQLDDSTGMTLDALTADTLTVKDQAGTGNGNLTVAGKSTLSDVTVGAGGQWVAGTSDDSVLLQEVGAATDNVCLKTDGDVLYVYQGDCSTGTTIAADIMYTTTQFQSVAGGSFRWTNRGRFTSPADAQVTVNASGLGSGVTLDAATADTLTVKDQAGTGNGNLTVAGKSTLSDVTVGAGGQWVAGTSDDAIMLQETGDATDNVCFKSAADALSIYQGDCSTYAGVSTGAVLADGSVRVKDANYLFWDGRSRWGSLANGQATLSNFLVNTGVTFDVDDVANTLTLKDLAGTGNGNLTVAGTSTLAVIAGGSTGDVADAEAIRLGNADCIAWEASPAGTDETLCVNASEDFIFSDAIGVPSSQNISFTGNSKFLSPAGGQISIVDNANTNGFTMDGNTADTLTIKDKAGTGNGNLNVTGTITVGTYEAHHDIDAGSAALGPTAPTWTIQDTYVGLAYDADAEQAGAVVEIPNAWVGNTDMTWAIYWASEAGTPIANGKQVKWDCSYRSIVFGTELTDTGTAVALTVTYTESGSPGSDSATHVSTMTIDYDHANQPLTVGDNIIILCDRDITGEGANTYPAKAIVGKWELRYDANTLLDH